MSSYGRRLQVRYGGHSVFFARRCVNVCWMWWCLRRCLRKVGGLRLACVFSVCSRFRLFVCVDVCEALSSPGDVYRLRSVAKYSLVRVPVAERASGSAVLSVFLRGFQSCRRLGARTAIFMRSVSRSLLCFRQVVHMFPWFAMRLHLCSLCFLPSCLLWHIKVSSIGPVFFR